MSTFPSAENTISIVLGGEVKDAAACIEILEKSALIICADGGMNYLSAWGINPDIFLGDYDSITTEAQEYLVCQDIRQLKYSPIKDDTDSALAIEFCLNLIDGNYDLTGTSEYSEFRTEDYKKITDIVLLAAFGSRIDHVFSNQLLVASVCRTDLCFAMTDGETLQWFWLGPAEKTLNWPLPQQRRKGRFVFSSVALSSEVSDLTYIEDYEGELLYKLNNGQLRYGSSLGISNGMALSDIYLSNQALADTRVKFGQGLLSVLISLED